jgi:hypothetical protein
VYADAALARSPLNRAATTANVTNTDAILL